MHETTKVLLAFDKPSQRVELKKRLFALFSEVEIVAEASSVEEVMNLTSRSKPHLILMGIDLEDGDGAEATRRVTTSYPWIGVIIVTDKARSQEGIRQAMLAGARAFLIQPIQDEELIKVVREVADVTRRQREEMAARIKAAERQPRVEPRIVTVLATKGGVGGSTVAVNLAASLAHLLKERDQNVALIDLDLQFGDAAIMLNLAPNRTIAGLVKEINERGDLDREALDSYLLKHPCGLSLLAAPAKPEQAELVHGEHIEKILEMMRLSFTYTVIDTSKFIQDPILQAISRSDIILLVLTLDLPSIKNSKLGLEIVDSLGYRDRVRIVVNRNEAGMGITADEIEEALGSPIIGLIPSSGRIVVSSVNEGTPFVLVHERTDVAKSIELLAHNILGEKRKPEEIKLGDWAKRILGLK